MFPVSADMKMWLNKITWEFVRHLFPLAIITDIVEEKARRKEEKAFGSGCEIFLENSF